MNLEATEKELIYKRVDPLSRQQIEDCSFCEREGFGTGLDPQELPSVLQFIARNGTIWLQYVTENGQQFPSAVIEFIPLLRALEYRPEDIDPGEYDLSLSPFDVIINNQERVFANARHFANDKDIVYHHGISASRRGKGYGTLLMNHALENTPYVKDRLLVCFPDAAKIDEENGELRLAPNEASFTMHLKAGFVLAGVVDPPVYDEALTYYSFIRPRKVNNLSVGREKEVFLNLADGSTQEVLNEVRKLTDKGYFGIDYSRITHQMRFREVQL